MDPVLNSLLVERRNGASIGIRIGRAITSRLTAVLSVDYSSGRLEMTPAAIDGIEANRGSSASAWSALLETGPFTGRWPDGAALIIADRFCDECG